MVGGFLLVVYFVVMVCLVGIECDVCGNFKFMVCDEVGSVCIVQCDVVVVDGCVLCNGGGGLVVVCCQDCFVVEEIFVVGG